MILGETEEIAYALSGSDAFQIETVERKVYDAVGELIATGLGEVAVYNAGTTDQELQWLFTPEAAGNYRVVYTVTIAGGQIKLFEQTVSVTNAPPSDGNAGFLSAISGEARVAITGRKDSTEPTDADLEASVELALLQIIESNPCVADDDGNITLTGMDLKWLTIAAGNRAARFWLGTPAGEKYSAGLSVTVEIDHVKETRKSSLVTDPVGDMLLAENQALGSIKCIQKGRQQAAANFPGLFGLAGRRRAIEANCRCGSPLYNGNRGGY